MTLDSALIHGSLHLATCVLMKQPSFYSCKRAFIPGNSYAHGCTNRVILSWKDTQRVATLVKSPSHKKASALYESEYLAIYYLVLLAPQFCRDFLRTLLFRHDISVTSDGFRGLRTETPTHNKRKNPSPQDLQTRGTPDAKRAHLDGL